MDTCSPKFFRLVFNFSAPLSSVILMIFGSAFFTTFISLSLNQEGYTREQIGVVQSAYFLGMLLASFQMEKLIRRVGHIQALTVFGSLATAATLLQALYQTFYAWILLRFVVGLSLAALYIVIESWMLYHSTVKTRGTILSLYMICFYASQAASQQVLSFISVSDFTPFLVSGIFICLSIIPVGLSTHRISLTPTYEKMCLLKIIKLSPFGVLGCFTSGLILSAIYSFFPLLAISRGIPGENLMSLTIAGGVLLQWPIGKLSDYFERRKTMLAVVCVTLALTILGYCYQDTTVTTMLAFSFVLGGFAFTLYPLSISQVCDHLDISHITTATSLMLLSFAFGSVFGPLTSSYVVDALGINALFLYFSVLLGGLGLLGLVNTIRKPIIPLDEQMDFVPLTYVTPVTYEMDPRGDEEDV